MAATNKNIIITPGTGTNNDPTIVFTGDGNKPVTLSVSSSNTIVFSSPSANILALGADGNVGIGTTSPTSLLDVAGSITIRNTITVSNITVANNFVISSNSGIAGNIVSTASATFGNLSILNATPTTSSTTGALTVNGGVGISGNAYIGGNIIYGGVTFANAVTGTGSIVLANTPILLTPNIGSATGNSFSAFATIRILNTTAPPAGGITGYGYKLGTGVNFGLFYGSGAPTLTANQGSLYLRSDGIPYYNTDGSTGWTQLVSSSGGTITGATTLAAPLTYGGVTLSNSAIGSGSMVLNNSPTFTGTITSNGNIVTTNSALFGNLAITNTTTSTSSTTGALTVAGGAGIGGPLFVNGTVDAQSIDNTAIGNITPNTGQFSSAQVQNGLIAGSISSNGLVSGSSLYSSATVSAAGAIVGSSITGNTSVTGGTISATSTLSTVDFNVTGSTSVTNVIATTSSTTGALKVSGGIATAANLFVAGASWHNNLAVFSSNTSTSTTTGAVVVTGGVGIGGNLFTAASAWHGNLAITNSTATTSSTTGALTVAGGVGIGGALTYGGVTLTNAVTGTGKMVLDTNPQFTTGVGLNRTASTGTLMAAGGNSTGATGTYGIQLAPNVQSDVTNSYIGYYSAGNTQATAFTLSSARHFQTNGLTLGATSTLSNQYGFLVETTFTQATNNYGFYGGIASGTGRYNLYMAGTADNYIGGTITLAGALTYGGVTLNNSVTGTGSMVLSSGPTITLANATGLPLTTGVTGTLGVTNGGTGQTSASAAFNALSPITSTGDLIIGNGVNSATRLAIGLNGYVLTSNGTTASWAAAPAASLTVGTSTITSGTSGYVLYNNAGTLGNLANTGSGNNVLATSPTISGLTTTGTLASANQTITSASANALAVGLNGTTNPALNIDASTVSSATGLNIKSAAAGAGVAVSAISSGLNENLTLDAKGTGTITLGGTSTGAITLTRATTLSAALTYGGVTLTNAVTGTGSMVLSASPTLSGTVGGTLTFSGGLTLSSALTYGGVTLTNSVTGTGSMVLSAGPTITGTLSTANQTITSASANALAVGPSGITNPALVVDASTVSSATGVSIKSAAAGAGVAVAAISSGINENLTINAKGTGTITLGNTSTGAITLTRATTISAALTYGGVTLTNAVTGTGSMVLSSSPSLTTPALGTPSSGTLTNCTGFPTGTTVTSVLAADTSLTANTTTSIVNTGSIGASGQSWLIFAQFMVNAPSNDYFTVDIFNGASSVTGTVVSIPAGSNTAYSIMTIQSLSAATTFTFRLNNTSSSSSFVRGGNTAGYKPTSIIAVRLS